MITFLIITLGIISNAEFVPSRSRRFIGAIESTDSAAPSESSFNRHSNDLTNATMRNLCYCSYGPDGCDYEDTCVKHKFAACFHAIKEGYNYAERRMETWHYYGCAPFERGSNASHLTCNIGRSAHSTPKTIACCYEGGYCNLNITPAGYSNADSGHKIEDYEESDELHNRTLFTAISISVGALIGILLIVSGWLIVKALFRKGQLPKVFEKLQHTEQVSSESSLLPPIDKEKSGCDSEYTWESGSGSDSGLVTLNQRTIALNLTLLEMVARGRYGEVRRALYRGSIVAVKIFYTTEEESWKNERDIYQTQMLNHENILQYVAADISSNVDALTQMLLVTDYHPAGSLYDYLRRSGPLELTEALGHIHSIISGLEHLHYALLGTGSRRKPEIAHRDLKSKNIIVKRPGVCCIADFGLAVRLEDGVILPRKLNVQVGTKRYMAPEVLTGRLNTANFEEFKMADIYSFALCLWEVCCRIQTCNPETVTNTYKRMISFSSSSGIASSSDRTVNSQESYIPRYRPVADFKTPAKISSQQSTSIEARPHSLPYQTWVETDPSFDEMRRLVCTEKKRPPLEDEWINGSNIIIRELTEMMVECWSERPKSRHTAYKIKKELTRLINYVVSQKSIRLCFQKSGSSDDQQIESRQKSGFPMSPNYQMV